MNIYVGNLSAQTNEQQLSDLFSPFGIVLSAKVIYDNFSGHSRGFAFIEMSDDVHAANAIKSLNESFFDRKAIVVNEARPRVERERFSRFTY